MKAIGSCFFLFKGINMAIPSKRFNFLTEDTNISTADFFHTDGLKILNSPNNEFKEIKEELEGFVKNKVQALKSEIEDAVKPIEEKVRKTKDLLDDLVEEGEITVKNIESMVKDLMPTSVLGQSKLSSMSNSCKKSMVSKRPSGKNASASTTCNGNKNNTTNKCGGKGNSGGGGDVFGSAISDFTGGDFKSSFSDPLASLTSLTSLSSMGYDLNMCGIFSSLSKGMDNNITSKASGSLLGELGTKGNVIGMLDLANSSAGLHTKLENPSGTNTMLKGYKTPDDVKENNISALSDRFTGAMEIFNEDWNKSTYDGGLSNQGIKNSDLQHMFHIKSLSNSFDSNSLNTIPSDDASFLSAVF
jgi:polyhydroxyalkanoate synthesis regulator phasin